MAEDRVRPGEGQIRLPTLSAAAVGIGEKYRTKAELVYAALRSSILHGELKAGDRIVLDQVASLLGVSKVPVREAVTRLVGEGWVVLRPHIGPVVPRLSADEVVETAVIRAAVEAAAVTSAVPDLSSDLGKSIQTLLRRMDQALSDPRADFPAMNRRFHSMMVASCRFAHLREMAETLMGQTVRYQTVRRVPDYLEFSQMEHWEMFAAASSGKAELAGELAKAHILTAGYRLGDQLREQFLAVSDEVAKTDET